MLLRVLFYIPIKYTSVYRNYKYLLGENMVLNNSTCHVHTRTYICIVFIPLHENFLFHQINPDFIDPESRSDIHLIRLTLYFFILFELKRDNLNVTHIDT